MTSTIADLFLETLDTSDRFWFVHDVDVVEQTDATVTLRLIIGS
jgi:hypothetical protein